MTYAPANQLATVNQQGVELDADGNMINGILKGQLTSFSFDSRNRLIQVGDTSYRYDAENHRIGINQTQFVVNPQPALSQVLVRTKGNGEVSYYVYGLGLIGEETNGEYIAYHFDYRGSTVALTNAVGQVVDRIAYSAYGELLTQPTYDTPFLFNGMYGVMSDDSGLYYMRARFYSPEIKRFVNQDVLLGSVGDGQSLNRFAFVEGRSVNSIDPFGNEGIFEILWENYPSEFITHSSDDINDLFDNHCAINVSEALLNSGIKIQSSSTKCWGLCSTNHIGKHVIRAQDLANALKNSPPKGCSSFFSLTGETYKTELSNKKGVIFFKDYWQRRGETGRTGDHIDLWNEGYVASQSWFENFLTSTLGLYWDGWYSNKALSKEVWFWECGEE